MSSYSLTELAKESGVEARTIRSWVQQGLIAGPEVLGRNARYPASSLARIKAISAMRSAYGMPLSAIRQELLVADAAVIDRYAAQAEPPAQALPSAASDSPPAGSTAAEYLERLRSAGVFGAGQPAPPPITLSQPAPPAPDDAETRGGSPLHRLVASLEAPLDRRSPRRKARGDVRMVIPVTPEVELCLRGNLAAEEIAYFERLADAIREWLNGGLKP